MDYENRPMEFQEVIRVNPIVAVFLSRQGMGIEIVTPEKGSEIVQGETEEVDKDRNMTILSYSLKNGITVKLIANRGTVFLTAELTKW